MHLSIPTLLAAATAAVAVPAAPPTTTSLGFHLRVRLTDASRDFKPSIKDNYLVINNGSPEPYDFLSINPGKHTRTWFFNGTQAEVNAGKGRVVDDYPDAVGSIYIAADKPLNSARISANNTITGVTISPASNPVSYLTPDQYYVCQTDDGFRVRNIAPSKGSKAPSSCVPVRLYPECTDLFTGGPDTKNAKPIRCYSLDTMPKH